MWIGQIGEKAFLTNGTEERTDFASWSKNANRYEDVEISRIWYKLDGCLPHSVEKSYGWMLFYFYEY